MECLNRDFSYIGILFIILIYSKPSILSEMIHLSGECSNIQKSFVVLYHILDLCVHARAFIHIYVSHVHCVRIIP